MVRSLAECKSPNPHLLRKTATMDYTHSTMPAHKKGKEDNWSLDACVGRAILNGEFSREFLMIPIANKTSECVMKAMRQLQETYSEHFSEVFKTITTDNGSEFADLSNLENILSAGYCKAGIFFLS